jgi:hypothetical protein
MTLAVPTAIYPVAERFVGIAKEATTGTPPSSGYVELPVAGFNPDPKLGLLEDKGLRGAMTSVYDLQLGSYWTEVAIPASPLFGDTIGHVLLNVFGDYTATGTAGTPTWTTSGALSPGAGPIAVTSASSAVAGTYIQIGTTTTAEIVKVGTGSTATSIVVDATTPIRFSHLTGIAVTTVVAPFTHVFNTLNPASATGLVNGQPPSHALFDRNQTAGSGGFYGDLYPFSCFSSLKISGAATGLLTWEGAVTCWPQTAPAGTITPSLSSVNSIPAWMGTSTIGGTGIYNIMSWEIDLVREVEPIPAVDGQQAPYVIARGPLDGTFTIDYAPASDQSALNNYLSNVRPTLVWTTSNGLSGSSLVSFSMSAQIGAFNSAKLTADKTLFGYNTTGILLGNTSNVGNSGGWGICTITLQNAVATY